MGERVTVFGAGYVGLVTGVCLSSAGHEVKVLDVDSSKLAALDQGRTPFFEPGLEDLMRESRSQGTLSFATVGDIGRFSGIVMVAVGTPATATGWADMTYVREVIDALEANAEPGTVVVMKSTVPPGTGRNLAARLAPHGILYASNPEFLREGTAVTDWFETNRVVLGGSPESIERVKPLYEHIDAPLLECEVTSAEMIKYASNAFLATKISFINEIAVLCDLVGATVDQVAEGVGMDERIGPAFLKAGIGYGGSCFPKDTRALDFLANFHGYDFHLLRAVIDVNARQRLLPVRALREQFGSLEDRRVAILGLTFKPDTDDTREAPASEIASLLRAEGAEVVGYNPIPVVMPELSRTADSLEDALANAHAVILATEWDEIVGADWGSLVRSMADRAVVFDGRNALDPQAIRGAGAKYIGVGRPEDDRHGAR
ncbi:MAG: UDP-glucose/GDP-mannose dehydrogenase family protein [Coriobacteriia bacterium]|nr:UDP-glucose/GDP-mannose dehydrogenase family protein [Coriobacteriia bacterium]